MIEPMPTFTKTYGKCWIYKRATLYTPSGTVKTLDYSNGTRPTVCEVEHNIATNDILYLWHLPTRVLGIPLNARRQDFRSIVRTGIIHMENGDRIEWEYIFGRYMPLWKYYLPYVIVYILLLMVLFHLLHRYPRN